MNRIIKSLPCIVRGLTLFSWWCDLQTVEAKTRLSLEIRNTICPLCFFGWFLSAMATFAILFSPDTAWEYYHEDAKKD